MVNISCLNVKIFKEVAGISIPATFAINQLNDKGFIQTLLAQAEEGRRIACANNLWIGLINTGTRPWPRDRRSGLKRATASP